MGLSSRYQQSSFEISYGGVIMADLLFSDGDGGSVVVHGREADSLWSLTEGFDAATVSACIECGSCILAVVAVVDTIDRSLPHDASAAIVDLADDAPTLHLYVTRSAGPQRCTHHSWRAPGFEEWCDAMGVARRPRRRR